MNAIQLEFNINNESDADIKFSLMKKQLDEMHESMGKVRRKLFSQMGEMQKLCLELKTENENLKQAIKEMRNDKTEWIYGQDGSLFDVRENQGALRRCQ